MRLLILITVVLSAGAAASGYALLGSHTAARGDRVTASTARAFYVSRSDNVPTLPNVVDSSTAQLRATFHSRAGVPIQVVQVERKPNDLGVSARSARGRSQCVVEVDSSSVNMACTPALFAKSHLIWVESAAGGPALSARTSYSITGLASPTVDRMVAVGAEGSLFDVSLSGGAFFVDLPTDLIAAGDQFDALKAYDSQGRLLETAQIH